MTFLQFLVHAIFIVFFGGTAFLISTLWIAKISPSTNSKIAFGFFFFFAGLAGMVFLKLAWTLLDLAMVGLTKLLGG